MKLQILIPRWSEDENTIRPLLDSIALQQGVDFREIGVIVADDGAERPLDGKFIWRYPFRIERVRQERRGVSAARNLALDTAEAEYVIFCDADDMFSNLLALQTIFREMAAGFDTLWSAFVEEARYPQTWEPVYILREKDDTFVHGKVHRRQFLIENGIRWDDRLTVHEDGYFHTLVQVCAKEMRYCERPFYLWRWRDGSVCRSDPAFMQRTYPQLLDAREALTDELARRGMTEKAVDIAVQTALDMYYALQTPAWLAKDAAEYRRAAEERFSDFWRKTCSAWYLLTEAYKARLSSAIRERFVREGMAMEAVTVHAWLRHIEEDYA